MKIYIIQSSRNGLIKKAYLSKNQAEEFLENEQIKWNNLCLNNGHFSTDRKKSFMIQEIDVE